MEALGAVGSIVGVVSLGVQISQILQKQIDEVKNADEKIAKFAIELRGASSSVEQLARILVDDGRAPRSDKLLNSNGRDALALSIQACNKVFRAITVLIAKSGEQVLAAVETFQEKVKKQHANAPESIVRIDIPLQVELSSIEHLKWPWRMRTMEGLSLDLEKLKSDLILQISVVTLARSVKDSKNKANASEKGGVDGEDGFDSDTETLMGEVYYSRRAQLLAERNAGDERIYSEHVITQDDPESHAIAASPVQLLESWPCLPDSREVVKFEDFQDSGLVLEAWSLASSGFGGLFYVGVPLPKRHIFDLAWKSALTRSKSKTIIDDFRKLPYKHQDLIQRFLGDIATGTMPYSAFQRNYTLMENMPGFPKLLYLGSQPTTWRRLLRKIRVLLPTHGIDSHEMRDVFAITARIPTESLPPPPPPPAIPFSPPTRAPSIVEINPGRRRRSPPYRSGSRDVRYPRPDYVYNSDNDADYSVWPDFPRSTMETPKQGYREADIGSRRASRQPMRKSSFPPPTREVSFREPLPRTSPAVTRQSSYRRDSYRPEPSSWGLSTTTKSAHEAHARATRLAADSDIAAEDEGYRYTRPRPYSPIRSSSYVETSSVPTREEKEATAEDFLRLWTTVYEHRADETRRRVWAKDSDRGRQRNSRPPREEWESDDLARPHQEAAYAVVPRTASPLPPGAHHRSVRIRSPDGGTARQRSPQRTDTRPRSPPSRNSSEDGPRRQRHDDAASAQANEVARRAAWGEMVDSPHELQLRSRRRSPR